ncbi:MAG: flavodoxin family protein [Desulfobulbaceae bacterium]|nr:flavodoxin family protein [Desulfobulbaceae bacterium]
MHTINVLIFSGSPRKNGNTEILVQNIMAGIAEAGGASELIRLAEKKIHPCIGCGGCEEEGNCVINDDMQDLYPKITAAQRIIIASPIYFYGVTAQTKAFIDRCQTMWSRKYILNMRSRPTVPRVGYFVGVAATKGERVFEGAILTVQYALDAMDFSYGGELVVRGADKKGAIRAFPEELARAARFGAAIVESRQDVSR